MLRSKHVSVLLGFGSLFALAPPLAIASENPEHLPEHQSYQDLKDAARLFPSREKDALHALLVLENARDGSNPFIARALAGDSVRVARQAALVLGRIGEASSEPLLVAALSHVDPSVRKTAAFSLGLLGSEKGREAVIAALTSEVAPQVRQTLVTSLGRLAKREDFPLLVKIFVAANGREKAGAAQGIAQLWQRERADWGNQEALFAELIAAAAAPAADAFSDPVSSLVNESAAVVLARFRGDRGPAQIEPLETLARSSKNAVVKMFALRSLGGIKSAETTLAFASLLRGKMPLSAPLRVEVALALGRQEATPSSLALLSTLLADKSARVAIQTLEALGTLAQAAESLAPAVEQAIGDSSRTTQEQKAALRALAKMSSARARAVATPFFQSIQAAADKGLASLSARDKTLGLESLGILVATAQEGEVSAVAEALTSLMLSPDSTLKAAAAEALSTVPAETLTALPLLAPHLAEALRSRDFRVTCHVADIVSAVPAALVGLAGDLSAAWEFFRAPSQSDGRLCLLGAMESLAGTEGLPQGDKETLVTRISTALSDSVAPVAQRAATAYTKVTGNAPNTVPVTQTKAQLATPSRREVSEAQESTLVLTTTRGEIHMRMLPAAPLTAVSIVRLARKGFYDGLSFHRIVPNFVSQGGDPRGDGWGGPGYLLRDEVSLVSHAPGTVGIATSGKDTGGSQFFINETHNFHLNGAYTVFARVTRGLQVARRLTEGDVILSAKVVR